MQFFLIPFFLGSSSTSDKEYLMKSGPHFSRFQRDELEKTFLKKKYPSSLEIRELVEKLKLSNKQVKNWYGYRRMKLIKQSHGMEMKSPETPHG